MDKKIFTALAMAGCVVAGMNSSVALADGSTTIGGKMYFDVTNINQKSDGVDTNAKGTNFDVKRFYVGVDHKFDDIWSANVTTDFNYVSGNSETQIYVKKAYLQAKLSDALQARIGSADLPWVPFVEGLYGYRFVENVLIDRTKYGTSADWGVHVSGKLANGMVNYAASVVNGSGYKKLTRSKSVDFEARIGAEPIKGLNIAGGLYTGKLGKDFENTPTMHTATRWDAVIAYVNSQFRVGAEYFNAKNWNQVTSVAEDKSDGYSVWGSFNFTKEASVFARYDHAKPSKDLNPALKDDYFNVGVAYSPRKGIDLALAYKHEKVKNGFMKVSNGTIGGVNEGKYDEIGIWGQVKF